MTIIDDLKQVDDFVYVNSISEFLQDLEITLPKKLNQDFTKFLNTTVILFENRNDINWNKYQKVLISLFNKDKGYNFDIHQVIKDHVFNSQNIIRDQELVETKCLIPNNIMPLPFNISRKILLSDNFQNLLKICKKNMFQYLLQNAIYLVYNDKFYIQINGKPLSYKFEQLNKTNKQIHTLKYKKYKDEITLESSIDRNGFLYCLHSNKKIDFFHKSFIYKTKRVVESSQYLNQGKKTLDKISIRNYILNHRQKDFFEQIFHSGLQIDIKTKTNLSIAFAQITANYCKIDLEKLFRKVCPLNFKQYYKAKKNLQQLKKDIRQQKDTEDIQSIFQKNFLKINKMNVPDLKVYRYLKFVYKKLFQSTLFQNDNKKIINKYLKKLIYQKRFETFKIKDIYNELDLNDLHWFQRKHHPLFYKDVIHQKKQLLIGIIHFIFFNFAMFIKANFYVTEKHDGNNQLFYYPKSIWYLIVEYGKLQMKIQNLEEIKPTTKTKKNQEVLQIIKYQPTAKLRFVPKGNSVRPIMTFYRKFKDSSYSNSLVKAKNYLNSVKIVLRTVKQELYEGEGFSIFDNHQIFEQISEFIKKWKLKDSPELYATTLDIKKCYDSVNLTKMIDYIKNDSIIHHQYLVNNFYKIMRNKRYNFGDVNQNEKCKKKLNNLFMGKRRDTSNTMMELVQLSTYFKDKIIIPNQTIFIDSGNKYLYTKEEILKKIQFICNNVFVKFGKTYYRLNRGLPQGLSISSVLSSYYYSSLEKIFLSSYIQKINDQKKLYIVLRLTDDYLIISDEKNITEQITKKLLNMANESNFKFNKKKFRANFNFENFVVDQSENFKWIGKIINLKTMEIHHTQILDKREAFYTVNINFPQDELAIPNFLKGKLKTFILNQNSFYFNSDINGKEKIEEIIDLMMQASFIKLDCYFNLFNPNKLQILTLKQFAKKVGFKLIETLLDTAKVIQQSCKVFNSKRLETKLINLFVNLLKKSQSNKLKFYLLKHFQKFQNLRSKK